MVENALGHMPKVESLSFTELRSDLLTYLRGKCEYDRVYSKVWNIVKGNDPSPSFLSSDKLNQWKNFTIDDGYLFHKGGLCVPRDSNIGRQILYECHDSPSAGHPRICKTYAHLQRNSYWPRMHKDVEEYVMHCQKCQVNKAECLKASGLLHPLEIPNGKWESISMDFIGGLSTKNCGYGSIWVVVDQLTKMCQSIPTKAIVKTLELASLFVENVYCLYGLLATIIRDCDRKFDSHFWRAVFKRLDKMLNLSTIDHPQIDGQIERVNQVLKDML